MKRANCVDGLCLSQFYTQTTAAKGALQELMRDLAPLMQTWATVSIGFAFIARMVLSDLALYHLAGSVASALEAEI